MDVFEAIADPVRRAILTRVAAEGPTRVVDLAADHDVSRPAVSRHLRVLSEAGLLRVEARGRERRYRLADDGLAPVRDWLSGLRTARPPIAADRLDALDLEVRRTTRESRPVGRAGTNRQEHSA
ncbi:ArsR/SmtB family transcription factor [Agilicoccus flavus]|uniref:ArsR/SmtB family transcription factor n=1 Tax=Agilicoccus flavus TaxID=2775968 RepID=UPI001CF6162D|nr:metalloregulator ArsR/SmtB family transcription factor [Agilicoccus flavus]